MEASLWPVRVNHYFVTMPFHICAERKIHILIYLILSGLPYYIRHHFLFSSWLLLSVEFFSFLKEVRPRFVYKISNESCKKKQQRATHLEMRDIIALILLQQFLFVVSLLYGNVTDECEKDVGQVSTPFYPKHVIIIVVRKINIYAFWMMIEPSKRPHQSSSFYYTTSGSFLLLASGEPDQDFWKKTKKIAELRHSSDMGAIVVYGQVPSSNWDGLKTKKG